MLHKSTAALVFAMTVAGAAEPPDWLQWSATTRGRVEYRSRRPDEAREFLYLQRLRVSAGLTVRDWVRAEVEAEDARGNVLGSWERRDESVYPVQVRRAYLDFGRAGGVQVRVGRQGLRFGDESLLGSDDEWCNVGRSFDAARISFRRGSWEAVAFSGRPVERAGVYWARSSVRRAFSGGWISWTARSGLELQPFLFWKVNRGSLERSLYTYGVSMTGGQRGLRYSGTAALQKAATHAFSLGVSRELRAAVTVSGGYRMASGGGPRRAAFDDLYPSAYNPAGVPDPFSWRNLREVSGGLTWHREGSIGILVDHHLFWVASLTDGVYTDDGPPSRVCPRATTARLGAQTNAGVGIPIRGVRLLLGGGRFTAGPWMKLAGRAPTQATAYVSVVKSFGRRE